MKQIKIFWNTEPEDLERDVNEWMRENSKQISITSVETTQNGPTLTITVLYTDLGE